MRVPGRCWISRAPGQDAARGCLEGLVTRAACGIPGGSRSRDFRREGLLERAARGDPRIAFSAKEGCRAASEPLPRRVCRSWMCRSAPCAGRDGGTPMTSRIGPGPYSLGCRRRLTDGPVGTKTSSRRSRNAERQRVRLGIGRLSGVANDERRRQQLPEIDERSGRNEEAAFRRSRWRKELQGLRTSVDHGRPLD